MRLSVTRKFYFCYGHHLPKHKGKCRNFHGHNCTMEVTLQVEGRFPILDKETGILVDFKTIDLWVKSNLIEHLDHKNLNEVLPEMFLPPTAENLCAYALFELRQNCSFGEKIKKVRIYENKNSYAEMEMTDDDFYSI